MRKLVLRDRRLFVYVRQERLPISCVRAHIISAPCSSRLLSRNFSPHVGSCNPSVASVHRRYQSESFSARPQQYSGALTPSVGGCCPSSALEKKIWEKSFAPVSPSLEQSCTERFDCREKLREKKRDGEKNKRDTEACSSVACPRTTRVLWSGLRGKNKKKEVHPSYTVKKIRKRKRPVRISW